MQKSQVNTIPQLLRKTALEKGNFNAQLSKNDKGAFIPTTYEELYENVLQAAAGLIELKVKRGAHIGLLSDNRKEWLIANLAILSLGAADIPRGRDSTTQEIQYILAKTESALCFVENKEIAEKVFSVIDDLPRLKTIIIMDKRTDISELSTPRKITIYSFNDLMEKGEKKLQKSPNCVEKEIDETQEGDLATIIFTSGTTGTPKGVMLCHKNFLHQTKNVPKVADIKEGDIWLSVLPVWHSFERIMQFIAIQTASTIAYSKPIGKIMLHDFTLVKPMWMASVPRIWEAVMDGVYKKVNAKGGITKVLFNFFVGIGSFHVVLRNMFTGKMPEFKKRSRFLDALISIVPMVLLWPLKKLGDILVFKSIQQKLGGRLKAGVSGGGSLPDSVDSFFAAAGITLLNGYGLTETAPVIAIRPMHHQVPYTVEPFPETEIRILDEKGNDCPPGVKGKIYARGEQIMLGYYKDPEATRKILSENGLLDTGDLGVWTHNGEFAIRGRAKDTIVLIGGENLEPGPIEAKLRESQYIQQAVVVGQDRKYLGALIVPDFKEIEVYLKNNGIVYHNKSSLADMDAVRELIQCEISERINTHNGFKSFEHIYKFAILKKGFELGAELSAKQEVKRHVIREKFKKEIESLYKS
ncbi:MAG: AMP-dependent synthetase/ligase [Spirochaetia bacterium]